MSDVTALHGMTPTLAKRLSDSEMHLFPSVRTNDSVGISVVLAEMRRRENASARQAVWVSVLALLISIAGLFIGK